MMIKKPHEPFGEPGGEEYDDAKFREGQLQADLYHLATKIDYRNGKKIVDAILREYNVTAKSVRLGHPKKEEPDA